MGWCPSSCAPSRVWPYTLHICVRVKYCITRFENQHCTDASVLVGGTVNPLESAMEACASSPGARVNHTETLFENADQA